MFFDADTHVDECADTWSYFPKSMQDLKPVPMVFEDGEQPGYTKGRRNHRAIFIDGHIFTRQLRSDEVTGTTQGSRELLDVPPRLDQMDELGVAIQVIFPTLLLMEVTRRPELEIAVCESYNRWIADRCAESGGRLRWAAVLPFRSIPDALKEMRRAKESGASAILKRGYECDERRVSDPYFDPVYALAQEFDMAVCIHVGSPYTGHAAVLTKLQPGLPVGFYVQDAFFAVVRDELYRKFPTLRFGFVEAAAGWVPHVLWWAGFDPVTGGAKRKDETFTYTRERVEEFLSEARLFVTCEVSENIQDIIAHVGDRCLMVGSDFCHTDQASVRDAQQIIQSRSDLAPVSIERINRLNAEQLYGVTL